MSEENANNGDTVDAALPAATCTDLTVREDPAELIYSFFSPGKVGLAFHESAWTPEMCVSTLVDLAQNCPDQKIRMEAIKYLDEKAKQSMMLSGRMEEVSRTLTKKLPDGSRVLSFRSLLNHLSAVVRNTCRCPNTRSAAAFTIDTNPDPKQQRALDLLKTISV